VDGVRFIRALSCALMTQRAGVEVFCASGAGASRMLRADSPTWAGRAFDCRRTRCRGRARWPLAAGRWPLLTAVGPPVCHPAAGSPQAGVDCEIGDGFPHFPECGT